MVNLDALLDSASDTEAQPCVIGKLLINLPDPYGLAVRDMLKGELSADVVRYRLKSAGLRGGTRSIQIHRRGICGCPAELYA